MATTVSSPPRSVGELLRDWRQRRRRSQLDLAVGAEVSARHLSFVETGRSKPSRELVLHLAEHLDVPLRERNTLLLAAGYAPTYRETPFGAPEMAAVRSAITELLAAHPYPALVVDRRWNLVEANPAAMLLVRDVDPELLEPPVNVVRLGLHPNGLPRTAANAPEFSRHLLGRLERQVELTADAELAALLDEVRAYLPPGAAPAGGAAARHEVVTTLALRTEAGEIRFFTTIATVGTPLDVTAAELAIETFLPADPDSAERLRQLLASATPPDGLA